MPKFSYRAKNGPTEIIEGVIDAVSRDQAVEKIGSLGYLAVYLEECPEKKETSAPADRPPETSPVSLTSFFGRVRSRDVTVFSRQLASLIKSGVPILRAISIIQEQSENRRFQKILAKISADVREGKSFSASLLDYPDVFPPFYIAMVRAGEDSGTLQEALLRIAAYRQKQEEMLSRFRSAMAYPILMALVGIGTVVFMFTFVLPKLITIFAQLGQELPWPTRIVMAISLFLRQKGLYFAAGIAAFAFFAGKLGSKKSRKKLFSVLSLKIPFFNNFLLFNELARFCRTLEILIKSGIPILKGISISVPILDNEVIKAELTKSALDLEQGSSFGKSLRRFKVFPPFLVSLIAVGEESGKLDEALGEIADTYEHECDEAVKVMTSLLEPMMILVMGLIVGFMVVAMLLPIFSMNVMAR